MQTPAATPAQAFEVIKLLLAAVGFIVGIVSIILVYVQMRKTHEWNRRKASHDTLGELVTGNMGEFRRTLAVDFGVELGAAQTYNDVEAKVGDEDGRKLRHSTFQVLNYLEVLCVGMKNHVLDEDICYDNAKFIITRYWQWARPLIEARRKATNNEKAWIEVENYANRWLEREVLERKQYAESLRLPGKGPT